MAQTKFGDLIANTTGNLPPIGTLTNDFVLTAQDMKEVSISKFRGKNIVLNIFPSIDTDVCAASVREFNKRAASVDNTVVLCISKDLPFALKRFCAAEGIENAVALSDYKNKDFGKNYGVEFIDGPFTGLLARAVIVLDNHGKVKHTELVSSNEPNYDAAIEALT